MDGVLGICAVKLLQQASATVRQAEAVVHQSGPAVEVGKGETAGETPKQYVVQVCVDAKVATQSHPSLSGLTAVVI